MQELDGEEHSIVKGFSGFKNDGQMPIECRGMCKDTRIFSPFPSIK